MQYSIAINGVSFTKDHNEHNVFHVIHVINTNLDILVLRASRNIFNALSNIPDQYYAIPSLHSSHTVSQAFFLLDALASLGSMLESG